MARCYALRAKLQITHVFDIDLAVGPNCPNRRDDVMLAQYLMAVFFSRQSYDPQIDSFLNGKLPVACDGIFGSKTKAYIEATEMWLQKQSTHNVVRDSRLDPMKGPAGLNGKMWILNQHLQFAGGLQGGIPSGPVKFPDALRPSLYLR
jgi:hypothetical protein